MEMLRTVILLVAVYTRSNEVSCCKVRVSQGTLIGESLELVTNDGTYCSFKGIPYGQPPTGTLRFKVSLPAKSWNGQRKAKEHGPVCPQIDVYSNVYIPGGEDCLYLNVYSPNITPDTLLPVLFYIHGGGFKSGSGNVADFGPDFFMRGDCNVVLVTINYRLDALGFLSLGTKDVPGNAGLKDQVLALKWVQTNIKQFGGDPSKVTIMGESAGAACVGFHLVSPMSTGLFLRGIALSGSPYNDWALPYKQEMRAFKFGKQLGFETGDSNELLTFLQSIPSIDLVNYTATYILTSEEMTSSVLKQYTFSPVAERNCGGNSFLCVDLLSENRFSHVNEADVMFGYTNEETVVLIPFIINVLFPRYDAYVENFAMRKVCQNSTPDVCLEMGTRVRDHYLGNKRINVNTLREFIAYLNEGIFKYDIVRYYSQVPNQGKKYMYQFSSFGNRNLYGQIGVPYGLKGAAHFDDLRYLFDPKALNFTLNKDSVEFEVIERFTTLVKNFVHCGDPTPIDSKLNIKWPQFDTSTMKYLNIGTPHLNVRSLLGEKYYKFWLQLLESLGFYY